jgi:hypothetical protein
MTAPSRNCGGSIGGLLTQYGVAFVVTVVKKDHEIAYFVLLTGRGSARMAEDSLFK